MARFDVYRNGNAHQSSTPYVLDVQSNHLDALNTRIVIPLRRLDRFPKVPLPKDLCPVFLVEGIECLLDAPKLAAIPKSELKIRVISLVAEQAAVMTALDRLFGAF
ncbi:MAG: CcdB family protein [Burkholderiaceae bacterium]|nr:CcdB family protein [Burkholderiaceae bacterium]